MLRYDWIVCLLTILKALLMLVLMVQDVESVPIVPDPRLDTKAVERLKQWGYLPTKFHNGNMDSMDNKLQTNHRLTDALKTFQRFAHINVTGILDNTTLQMMDAPRCGLPDIITTDEGNTKRRRKRFITHGTKWNNKDVTWQLETGNNDGISDETVRTYIARAFHKWSEYADINFIELPPYPVGPPPGSSQIRVSFEEDEHGDGFPFDGRSKTLAHAFFPQTNEGISGDIHFDDAEHFTVMDEPQSSGKIKLFWVAVHELGHSLGLAHSLTVGAVMYPFYTHFPGDDFSLTPDDIQGIRSIYGFRRGPVPTDPPVTKTTVTPTNTACLGSVTAAFLPDSEAIPTFFNARERYISNSSGFVEKDDSIAFPNHVGAIHRKVANPNLVVLLHGDTFSVYDKKTYRRIHSERKITDGYHGLPKGFLNPDAAFILPVNQKLYMFKGSQFWRFTENFTTMDYTLDSGYPKQINFSWYGVPDDIDAAFVHSNHVYFFKGDEYYLFDVNRMVMNEGYPRKNKDKFMRCSTVASSANKNINFNSVLLLFFTVYLMSL